VRHPIAMFPLSLTATVFNCDKYVCVAEVLPI